jgi:NADPH:quinone reductase-like Zn-dependent oxidoreductase
MKVYEIQGAFGLENLKQVDRPEPGPRAGEVLLKMRAASLNYRDIMTVGGSYNPRQQLPLIPCSDGVGEVIAVGDGVTRFGVGDRVATLFCQGWLGGPPTAQKLRSTLGGPFDGTLAEMMVLSEHGVVRVPEHLSDVEGSTLPCAALTAWSALVAFGNVTAGSTILVQGTGGVSIFALQFANMLGARAIVTSSSNEKLEKVRELGSWKEINYTEDPEWGKTVRKLTGGVGVDNVVEVGGADTLQQSLRAVGVGGQITVIGVLSGVSSKLNVVPVLMQSLRLQGILVGSRDGFEDMNRAIEANQLHPVVDRVFPFSDVPEAFEYMMSGAHLGKVCIEFQ